MAAPEGTHEARQVERSRGSSCRSSDCPEAAAPTPPGGVPPCGAADQGAGVRRSSAYRRGSGPRMRLTAGRPLRDPGNVSRGMVDVRLTGTRRARSLTPRSGPRPAPGPFRRRDDRLGLRQEHRPHPLIIVKLDNTFQYISLDSIGRSYHYRQRQESRPPRKRRYRPAASNVSLRMEMS
jgi:hypothetical protein